MKKLSQSDRILRVLKDGRWHLNTELYKASGCKALNSRISDMRAKKGLDIECRPVAVQWGTYEYRLVPKKRALSGGNGDGVRRVPAPLPPLSASVPGCDAAMDEVATDALLIPGQLELV